MACFLAPTAAAIAASSIRKKVPAKYHIDWLIFMLWGGVVMFAIEHIIKGEIIFYPPFLTAMKNGASINEIFKEIATLGVEMTIGVVMLWAVLVLAVNFRAKNISNKRAETPCHSTGQELRMR